MVLEEQLDQTARVCVLESVAELDRQTQSRPKLCTLPIRDPVPEVSALQVLDHEERHFLDGLDVVAVGDVRVQAEAEKQKILADMEAGKASARAKKIRDAAEMTLVQAAAVADAESAAADAEKQNYLAGEAHIRARNRLGVIKHVLEVKRVFEDEEAPIDIRDYSKREREALTPSRTSPLPTLDEILAE